MADRTLRSTEMLVQAVATALPPDLLRVVFLKYYGVFWWRTSDQVRWRIQFRDRRGLCRWTEGELRVSVRGGPTKPAWYLALRRTTDAGPRWDFGVDVRADEPLAAWQMDRMAEFVVDDVPVQHELKMVVVACGQLCGEWGYRQWWKRRGTNLPGRAYVARVLLAWLTKHDVPMCATMRRHVACKLRAEGIGEKPARCMEL